MDYAKHYDDAAAEADRTVPQHPSQRTPVILATAGIIASLCVFIALYAELPWLIDGHRLHHMTVPDQQSALSTDRDDLLKILAGAAGLVAIIYTVRRHNLERRSVQLTQETLQVTRERDAESALLTRDAQVTDRYTKAIGQLASSNQTECLGGIYALERIMHDSERDHQTIVEVLAAFVREHAKPTVASAQASDEHPQPSVSVQAALTVIGRRPQRHEINPIDFHGTWLPGVNLPGAYLKNVNFTGAILSGSNLVEANLEHAYLSDARLQGANLAEAHLEDASLYRTNLGKARLIEAHLERASFLESHLEGANLSGAYADGANFFRAQMERTNLYGARFAGANLRATRLTGANLRAAYLENANLSEADLTGVKRVTAKQLSAALVDRSTILPPDMQLAYNDDEIYQEIVIQSIPEKKSDAPKVGWINSFPAGPPEKTGLARIVNADDGRDDADKRRG